MQPAGARPAAAGAWAWGECPPPWQHESPGAGGAGSRGAEEAEPAKGAGAPGPVFKRSERLPVNPNDPVASPKSFILDPTASKSAPWKRTGKC